MKLYINRKILWGLIISILIIVGLGVLSYWFFLNLSASSQWANHARRVLQNVEEIRSTAVSMENSRRGFLLTGKEKFIGLHEKNIKKLGSLVDELDNLTSDNKDQQQNIDTLRSFLKDNVEFSRHVIETKKEDLDLVDISETKAKVILGNIQEEEQSLILSRSLNVNKEFYQFVYAFVGLLLVTLCVLISLVWLINSYTRSRNIAEQRLLEAELETKKINHDLEAFSYSVSHDLRAPLRSINGYSQILIEDYSDKIDDEGNRLLNVIISNAKRMGQLIDDLLEFSRLGRLEIRKAMSDVDNLVRGIASELMEREQDRKIEMNIQPLGTALTDSTMMRQVWINLIGNALKYSRNKEVTKIEIGRVDNPDKKDNVTFFIKDNGAGFDMAYVDKLFGVFQRLHKTNEFEGTGVGLALVKRIVDRHKGRIWADAKVGEGATFYIELPME